MAWQASRRHVWIAVGIIVLLTVAILIFLDAYHHNWQFTSFALDLLIIPIVLAGIAYWLNRSVKRYEFELQEQRAATERTIAVDTQREAALQQYLDRMADLLLEKGLRTSPPTAEVRAVARSRTLTVLRRLDEERKGNILRFLYDSNLLNKDDAIIDLRGADLCDIQMGYAHFPRIALAGTDLSRAVLGGSDLCEADLSNAWLDDVDLLHAQLVKADLSETEMWRANLSWADLTEANLNAATLRLATLQGADLRRAVLTGVNLMQSNLRQAKLDHADLREAMLEQADLFHAQLVGANLADAVLTEAKLIGTNLTNTNLDGAMLTRASYTTDTEWPAGFDPQKAGASLLDEASPLDK